MNKALAIMFKYPNADPMSDFMVMDDGYGNQTIAVWNIKDESGNVVPLPTDDDLALWWIGASKKIQIDMLNDTCNQTILGGFTSQTTGHTYDFAINDQINFIEQMGYLNLHPEITSFVWNTKDAGVVSHTIDQFMGVLNDVADFKWSNIQKYWEKKSQVEQATTLEEIQSITW